jgi:hypothetical protein
VNIKERLQNLPPPVKEWGVFAAWIGALLLVGTLAWALTGPVRSRVLIRQANRSLVRQDSIIRLDAPLSTLTVPGRISQIGFWFTLLDSEKHGVVFSIMSGSFNAVVLGIVDVSGRVEELIPLSANARSQFSAIPVGTMNLYLRRIEESYGKFRWEGRHE